METITILKSGRKLVTTLTFYRTRGGNINHYVRHTINNVGVSLNEIENDLPDDFIK